MSDAVISGVVGDVVSRAISLLKSSGSSNSRTGGLWAARLVLSWQGRGRVAEVAPDITSWCGAGAAGRTRATPSRRGSATAAGSIVDAASSLLPSHVTVRGDAVSGSPVRGLVDLHDHESMMPL
jgi:hypothetical protein